MALRASRNTFEIGPSGWDQRSAPVRQFQDQMVYALLVYMSEHPQGLTLHRMTVPQNGHYRREVADVGSVW
jgi:hypothetical protein